MDEDKCNYEPPEIIEELELPDLEYIFEESDLRAYAYNVY